MRSTSCSSTVEPFLSYLALKSRLLCERYPLIWPNLRIWLSRWAVPARLWTTRVRSIIGNCCRNAFKNGILATYAWKVAWLTAKRCSRYWGFKAQPPPPPFDSFCRQARCTRICHFRRSFTPQCSGSLTTLAAPGMPCLKQ